MPAPNRRPNRVVLVTGGAGGIGRAVGRRFAADGCALVLADLNAAACRTAADELGCDWVPMDVTDIGSVERAVATVEERHGRLDVVHLNAGAVTGWGPFDEVPLTDYQRVVDVNIHGVVHGIRAALPVLERSGGGSIVVTASMAGLTPSRDPFYALAKTAVVGLVRSLAWQLDPREVFVNAVCPGFVDTPLVNSELRGSGYPLLSPDDVADAVVRASGSGRGGQAWLVQVGHEPEPYRFRGVPGPLLDDGSVAALPWGGKAGAPR